MDFHTVKQAVVRGFAWQGATKVVVQTASWLSTLFVARLIAPADYGVMAAAVVFAQLLVLLTELGLAQGLIQTKDASRSDEDGVFYLSLLLGLLTYSLLYLAAPTIADFYRMPILTDVLRLLGVIVILSALKTVPLAIAMRRMDFRYRSLVEMGSSLVMTATVITLALNGFGIWSLVWGPIVSNLVMVLAYLPLLGRWPAPTLFSRRVARLLSFGAKIAVTNLLYFMWSRADVMIIGKVLGERLLGLYSMAFQLAVLPLDKIGSIFNQVMFPALARLQDNLPESQRLFLDLHRYLLMICYPLLFGLFAVADDFVALLLTETWLPIVPFLQALCLISALRVSGMLMPPALYARGKPGFMVAYSVLCVMVLPPGFLLGAQYGLWGVIIAWAVAYPALYLVLTGICLRDLQLSWLALLRSAAPAVGASALMLAGVFAFRLSVGEELGLFNRLAASTAIGAVLYIGCLALLFREQLLGFKARIALLRGGRAET